MKIACIIPTFNGKSELRCLLDSFEFQTSSFDVYIVDSSSNDGTYELAKSKVPNVLSIPSSSFNHGGTRQMMVDKFPHYEAYIFLTQDAILVDAQAIEKLVAPLTNPQIGAVCGRQLPHLNASRFASHARHFNYSNCSQVKSIEDAPKLGIKTAFMSNSFAAYRKSALVAVGGFPSDVIFGEDMFTAAKMLLSGWKVAYAGDALCRHSHNYSPIEEFRRYFDIGVFHYREPWIRNSFGGAGGEGVRFIKSELGFLGLRGIHFWPEAIFRNFIKLFAYKLGQNEHLIPSKIKRIIGMNKRYWGN